MSTHHSVKVLEPVTRRRFLGVAALATSHALFTPRGDAQVPTQAGPLDEVALRRPLRGGRIPGDIARRLGTAHVSGRYHFTEQPFMIEGAERVHALGLGAIKLWFASVERGYRANSAWKLPASYTFKELAEHSYFQAAFALPFSCIALELYPVGLRDTMGMNVDILATDGDFAADETQVYELTAHLLRTYRERDVTFLLQNWEGDWMLRGASRRDWREGRYPDLARRVAAFSRWFTARQRGVERARVEISDTRCRVLHAVEVNKVFDLEAGMPTVTSHVLPSIRPDYVSWSCYDGLKTEARSGAATAAGLLRGLDLIQRYARTTQRDFAGKPAVYIGEIGFPEQIVPEAAVTEMLDSAMGALLAREVPYTSSSFYR